MTPDVPPRPPLGHVLYARRMHTRYLVARAHPAPERVRARLDEATGDAMRSALARMLRSCVDAGDEAVWCIRRLDVDVTVNTEWDREQLAIAWARKIALALVETMSAGGDGVSVMRFSSRIEYVSRFLVDLVAGHAWSRWYYDVFEGVKPLPVSAAIRTIVCDDPIVGLDALLALRPAALAHVIGTLSAQDVRQVLRVVPDAGHATSVRDALLLVWQAYTALDSEMGVDGDVRTTLRLLLEAVRVHPEAVGPTLIAAARALAVWVRLVTTRPEIIPLLLRALPSGANALYAVLAPDEAEAVAPMTDAELVWVDMVTRAVGRSKVVRAETVRETPAIRATPFGGAFLLLPFITPIPFGAATAGWSTCGETDAAHMARFLVLAKCLGGSSLPRLLMDATLRDVMGLDPAIGLRDVTVWLSQLTDENVRRFRAAIPAPLPPLPGSVAASLTRLDVRSLAFPPTFKERTAVRRALGGLACRVLRDFAKRLPGFSQSSLAHLRANFLDVHASLEIQPMRRVVRVSRPPLDIILNMTGMSRASYTLPWLDARPFVLFPESAA